ncbi:hypothetical protein [Mucilaginibacter aquatilis]|uniref:Uncharacterized protein n=1 Tax=Mucilaginibacter aquatilis TaxID=1517760 RepID=A0A6I4IDV0_9SPHI|nr:hypothetical protein [Mucilaginibacter aquatilis]MVN91776.1 hypothetical protein [Mucilaginibacter aquatilis]
MAKDIKAIKCPHCGSVQKTEVKPDFYRCENCGTEYFLDSDDVHIYHHHTRQNQQYVNTTESNSKLPIYILIGTIAFIVIAFVAVMVFSPKKEKSYSSYTNFKTPRMHYSNVVYENTATGDPIYLRIGADQTYSDNGKSEFEMHTQYVNAATGKIIEDRVMDGDYRKSLKCDLRFKTFRPDMTYAIGCNTTIFHLDTRSNQITDITSRLFDGFPQLSSGIAQIEFDYSKPMINIMNNEGTSFHYFPTLKVLVSSDEEANKVWESKFDRFYFSFGYLGSWTDDNKYNQLIENRYSSKTAKLTQRDLTPGRKYFNPEILYQDKENLLIKVNTTAANNSPISIQSINVQSGKLNWALPPDRYYLYSATKCKQGFAIEYRKDEEADYAHGVIVASNEGKLINNYQLGRTE